MKKFRIFQQIYAHLFGYFWLPCPVCGKYFGGHECHYSIMTSWHSGQGVCDDCKDYAKEYNQKFMDKFPIIWE